MKPNGTGEFIGAFFARGIRFGARAGKLICAIEFRGECADCVARESNGFPFSRLFSLWMGMFIESLAGVCAISYCSDENYYYSSMFWCRF